jgi:hypothetical protein
MEDGEKKSGNSITNKKSPNKITRGGATGNHTATTKEIMSKITVWQIPS